MRTLSRRVLLALLVLAPIRLAAEDTPSANGFLQPDFPVTSQFVNPLQAIRVASNGTNWLAAWHPIDGSNIEYARISGDGTVERGSFPTVTGPYAVKGVTVASDGEDYLVSWVDDDIDPEKFHQVVRAAKLSGTGTLTNAVPVTIHDDPELLPSPQCSAASDGTNWLVTFPANFFEPDAAIVGVPLSSNLVASPAFRISAGEDLLPAIAFNGTVYLCAWRRSNNGVYGARISTSRVVLDTTNILINNGAGSRDDIQVTSDGTNFLVGWTQNDGTQDARGVYVDWTGVPDTNVFLLCPGWVDNNFDLCYSGYEYVASCDAFDTNAGYIRGGLFNSGGEQTAQFSFSDWSGDQGIASDQRGRILIVAMSPTGLRGRFLDTRPRVSSVSLVGNQASVSWLTVKGRSYQLEQTSDLASIYWPLAGSTVTATNSSQSMSLPTNGAPWNFYRVRQSP